MGVRRTRNNHQQGSCHGAATGSSRGIRENGFSLIEVLVALGILAIIVLGIVGLFTHSMAVNASGFDYAKLASVGRQVLENIQSRNFNDPALAATASAQWQNSVPDGMEVIYSIQDYAITDFSQVRGTGPNPPPWPTPTGVIKANLKKITIRVRSKHDFLKGRREFVVTALKTPSGRNSGGSGLGGAGQGGGGP
ncbi:MAG: prepilin-type N-terminal cleavage/methylation domain-containing protein [Acidobacteria bacterium]|nr:prepilin-type N-terminal cleavage/methylation domain-containing protein [Acidobacteriota bacterium]